MNLNIHVEQWLGLTVEAQKKVIWKVWVNTLKSSEAIHPVRDWESRKVHRHLRM